MKAIAELQRSNVIDDESIYYARINGELITHPQRFKLIDLFSGAGGLTLGFSEKMGHAFIPVWANDFNLEASKTYEYNFKEHCYYGDIVDLLKSENIEIPQADVVIGGPPCQGFSLLNKKRHNDPRKQLWKPFLEVVKKSGASVFVMENVPQLLGSEEHEQIVQEAEALGYKLTWAKLCAADYGVSQTRRRAFIIGCNFTDPSNYFPPKKTHFNIEKRENNNDYILMSQPWRNVKDAIGDLPAPSTTEISHQLTLDLHFGRKPTELSLKRYRAIPEEGMNRFDLQRLAPELTPDCWIRKKSGGTDLFGRLWWNRPAFTIRTEFFKPEKGRYLHPKEHRPITHREAARLQSFPDDFKFVGSKTEIARQIGNAVPPLLAARVADSVYTLLLEKYGHVYDNTAQQNNVAGKK